jgi:hypothetical protein
MAPGLGMSIPTKAVRRRKNASLRIEMYFREGSDLRMEVDRGAAYEVTRSGREIRQPMRYAALECSVLLKR